MRSSGWYRFSLQLVVLSSGALLLSVTTHAALTRQLPSPALWLFAARFACLAGLLLALVQAAFAWRPRTWFGRGLAALGVTLAALPLYGLGEALSGSDGLRARGYSPALLQALFTLLLALPPLACWLFQRRARPSAGQLALGLGGALLCLALAASALRTWPEIAALSQACALLLGARCADLVAPRREASRRRLGPWLAAPLGVLLAAGLLAPNTVAEGRRQALREESVLELVAGRLLAPGRPPAAPSRARCAELLQPETFPLVPTAPARRNVVLISIDSVRADYVRRSMNGRPLMPELTRFGFESQRAPRAYTAYPATALALRAAFTGLMPSSLLLAPRLPDSVFVSSAPLVDAREALLPQGNYFLRPDVRETLLRGLTVQQASGAAAQTDAAIARLRELRSQGKTHLFWLHYIEPHEPYTDHPETQLGASDRQRYGSELAFVDQQLGRLLSVLRQEGWYDDSMVAVFSDHGESFGERGHVYHHQLVYPWLIQVPFALHLPGQAAGLLPSAVHLTDIAPTVLHFLGAQRAPHAMTGRSLLLPDRGERVLLSEAFPMTGTTSLAYARTPLADEAALRARWQRLERGLGYPAKLSVTRGDHQLIVQRGSGAAALYQAARAASAADDRYAREPALAAQLEQLARQARQDSWQRALCQLPGAQAAQR